MSELILSEIWRYPVKSLRGSRLNRCLVDGRGLVGDRRWMLVDADARFVTQRECPAMSLVDAVFEQGQLLFSAPGMAPLSIPAEAAAGDELHVQVWSDSCRALAPSPEADAWFSDYLAQACRLVLLPVDSTRSVDPDYARPEDQVGFADGFPFLLISQASLDDLNNRLAAPVPMLRFRPNLVVSGGEPYQEDGWRHIRIGQVAFRLVKPCSRCIIPSIDPQSGQRAAEPLRTLVGYRKRGNKIYFGQNMIHDSEGEIRQGMKVEVLA